MPSEHMRDGMSREVAGRRWSLADVIAFYETHNQMPFPFAGGSDADGADGDGDDANDDGKGGEGDGDAGGAGSADGDGGKPKPDANGEDVTGLKNALKAEREANKPLAKIAKARGISVAALAKELAEAADAGKSELERVTGERDALKSTADDYRDKYRKLNAAEAIRAEATKAGADSRRVDRIVRLIRPDLEYDDDGDDPTNVSKLIADLKKTDADLFAAITGKADGGAGGGTKPKDDPNAALRRAAGRSG